MEIGLVNAKYIFLDVVDYSLNRHSEAQVDIINTLNGIVRLSIQEHELSSDSVVILPTGDGMCIGLINIDSSKYDINLSIAIDIHKKLYEYNEKQTDDIRKFEIRIGLNENVDNLIVDINGTHNLSGSGITLCQRVMGLADGGNILIGQQVFEVLSKREKYFKALRTYNEIAIKHGKINVFQFFDNALNFINNETPSAFVIPKKQVPIIPELTAAFLGLLKRDQEKIVHFTSPEGGEIDSWTLTVAYWYETHDVLGKMHETRSDRYYSISPAESLEELIKILSKIPFRVRTEFSDLIHKSPEFIDWIRKCTESTDYIYLTEYGEKKIEEDWPKLIEYLLAGESA